jgi:hypothetical protein
MANREKGESTYTVKGTTYQMCLDSDAMVEMESAASTPTQRVFFPQVMSWAQQGSWTHQRILVWASLRKHHPEITLKQAGDLMLDSATEEMSHALRDLAIAATPDPKDIEALGVPPANPPAAQGTRERARRRRGTGTVSTDTAAASV